MNVKLKGFVLGPASHFFDLQGGETSQVEGHGSSGSEGMSGDVFVGEAEVVEACVAGGLLDGGVHVLVTHMSPGCVHGAVDSMDGSVRGATVGEDVVHPAGQRSDWGIFSACAVLCDGLALNAGFGAGDRDGGTGGSAQGGEGSSVGNLASIGLPKGDVLDSKRNGLFALGRAGFCVFSDTEKVIEGDVGEVCNGLLVLLGSVSVGGGEGSLEEVLDNSDGDGKFGFHFGVFFEESSQGPVEAGPAGVTTWGDQGVWPFDQTEGRGDGAQRYLN